MRLKNDPSFKQFNAKIYDGHFERGGHLRRLSTFEIDKVLLFEQVQTRPQNSHQYFVLPQAQGSFLIHQIRGKGDFDQILESPQKNLSATLTRATPLTLPASDTSLAITRLIWWETADLEE